MKSSLLLSLVLSSTAFGSDITRGVLEKRGSDYFVKGAEGEFRITGDKKVLSALPSLESPAFTSQSDGRKYAFEFEGTISGSELQLEKVPTKVPGDQSLQGILISNGPSYRIGNKAAVFGQVKNLNGYEFDDISKNFYLGMDVTAEGYEDKGIFVIQSLTPRGLFSAQALNRAPVDISRKLSEVGAQRFLLKEVPKNELSQSSEPFRVTVAGDGEVEAGESALIITLSGRQGDSFGAVNGHFAAGMAIVEEDLSLRAEVSNAYVTNEKDILSGNTSLNNYYFHIVQGQNNYRPTYTLVAYGLDAKKLQQFRDKLENSHIKFRSSDIKLTPQFNCTTETVKALRSVGIKGKYSQIDNTGIGILTSPLSLPFMGESANVISFALRNDPAKFQPRPAYESFVKALLQDKYRSKHGIKRVDFIFHPQIPSRRPVGGMALGDFKAAPKFDKLERKYEIEQKLSPEELLPLLDQYLNVIE